MIRTSHNNLSYGKVSLPCVRMVYEYDEVGLSLMVQRQMYHLSTALSLAGSL
jgi:hypothetical protein